MKRWLASLLLALSVTAPLAADNQAYVNVQNWASEDVVVYIDGYNMGKVWKGYKECFPVPPGEHKVQAYKESDTWKGSLAWVNLTNQYPTDTVWVQDHSF